MGRLGAPELIIILVVVILLFGARKLPDLARSIGSSAKEFRKGIEEGMGEDEDEDREEYVQTARSSGGMLPDHLRDAAQALHPGRIVEMEPEDGGRTFEIETVGADGNKWKMVFDADGRLLRDERD